MEGTVTLPLTDYVELMDTVKELQSQVEKYAEQIQKEQLNSVQLKEYVLSQYRTHSDVYNKYFISTYKFGYLNDLGISDTEIFDYLNMVNT